MDTRRIKRSITIEISVPQVWDGRERRWRLGDWGGVYASHGSLDGWGSEKDSHFPGAVIRALRGVLTALNRDNNNRELRELLDLDTWEVDD